MGKSSKKAKSDRINALRKQYDAFLDEDKKRKNRNAYILGWLDRVRSAPTLTSTRHKENPCFSQEIIRREPEFINQKLLPILDPYPTNAIASSSTKSDEITILKEISKNYILIPKKHSTGENVYLLTSSSSTTNDSDWRSKYNILDELKKNEKEESLKEEPVRDISKGDAIQSYTKDNSHNNSVKLNELNLPMKINAPDEKSVLEQPSPLKINQNIILSPNITDNNMSDWNKNTVKISKNDIGSMESSRNTSDINKNNLQTENETNAMKSPENLLPKLELMTLANKDVKPTVQREKISQIEHDLKETLIHDKVETVVDSHDIPQNMEKVLDNKNSVKLESAQSIVENYVNDPEVQDTKHFEKPEDLTGESITHNPLNIDSALNDSNIQYQSEEGSNLLTENDIEGTEQQIEEYETEQNQLFYSNDTNQNYAYNAEEGQNIQSGNMAYDNSNYSYYEAVKDENNYATEINEHAEATERYDPNYQQQYINQYDENQAQYPNEYVEKGFYNVPEQNVEYDENQYENYEQQNYEHQQPNIPLDPQEYGDVKAYNPGVEKENQNTDYEQNVPQQQIVLRESMEQVEQQLDLEDGYSGNQNNMGTENCVENKNPVESAQEITQTT